MNLGIIEEEQRATYEKEKRLDPLKQEELAEAVLRFSVLGFIEMNLDAVMTSFQMTRENMTTEWNFIYESRSY